MATLYTEKVKNPTPEGMGHYPPVNSGVGPGVLC